MDDLKQSVQGAVYEQKDPLLIYKFESFKLFNELLDIINKDAIFFYLKLTPQGNSEVKNVTSNRNLIGRASRGQEERMPSQNQTINTQNQQKLTRQQKRAQKKSMQRRSGGKFKKKY